MVKVDPEITEGGGGEPTFLNGGNRKMYQCSKRQFILAFFL